MKTAIEQQLLIIRKLESNLWGLLLKLKPGYFPELKVLLNKRPKTRALKILLAKDFNRQLLRTCIYKYLPEEIAVFETLIKLRWKFIKDHRRLIFSTFNVLNFITSSNRDDILQEGSLALLKAMDKYDFDRSISFTTYAYYYIRFLVIRHHDQTKNMIRIPIGEQTKRKTCIPCDSLDRSLGDHQRLIDMIAEPTDLEQVIETRDSLKRVKVLLNTLPTKKKDILMKYYLEEHNLRILSEHYGCSRERIRQLKKEGLNSLKEKLVE